jgi:Rieske Fe-S protein
MGTNVILKHTRIGFTKSLFAPMQHEGKGAYKNAATFIIEPGSENDKILDAAIKQEAIKVWGDKHSSILEEIKHDKKAFAYLKRDRKNATTGETYAGFEGKYSITGKKHRGDDRREGDSGPPLYLHNVKDPNTNAIKRLDGSEGVIYAGCYVNAKLEIWAQKGVNNGLRCKLLAVQFDAHGDSFGGEAPPTDEGLSASDISVEEDLA